MNLPKIPRTNDPALDKYLRDLSVAIQKELALKYSLTTPTDSVLLVSPDGSVYTVAVADDGTLNTTLVQS